MRSTQNPGVTKDHSIATRGICGEGVSIRGVQVMPTSSTIDSSSRGSRPTVAPALTDINALSRLLSISTGTLYNWVYLRRIPYLKAGRCLRFDPDEVLASLHHSTTMGLAGKR